MRPPEAYRLKKGIDPSALKIVNVFPIPDGSVFKGTAVTIELPNNVRVHIPAVPGLTVTIGDLKNVPLGSNCYALSFGLDQSRSYGKFNGTDDSGPYLIDVSGPFFIENGPADTMLKAMYDPINLDDLRPGDIILIRSKDGEARHMAPVVLILGKPDSTLPDASCY
jgi:hypothetical protein